MPKLKSVKQENFCLHYAKTGNATESYKQAGYKYSTDNVAAVEACKLLKNPKIAGRIAEIAGEIASEKIADIVEIQEYLTSVMRREQCEHTVVVLSETVSKYVPDDSGRMRKQTKTTEKPQIVAIPSKLSDANKAAETLAKLQGAFLEKKSDMDKEEQRAKIDKIKAETARIKGEDPEADKQDDGFIAALRGEVDDIWDET